MNSGGGAVGALFLTLGLLLLFLISFGFFLILPFFIFLGGIVAMMISDRKRSNGSKGAPAVATERSEPGTEA